MKKRPSYLELGRRERFGKRASKPVGPIEPPPRPADVADFQLGTWHVQPATQCGKPAPGVLAWAQRFELGD